jgi:hypothetical protein
LSNLLVEKEGILKRYLIDFCLKCGILALNLKPAITGSNMEIGKKAEPFLTLP